MHPGLRRHCRLALAVLALIAGRADAGFSSEHVKACAACHGEAGRSAAEGYYPSIAGKPADYLYAQLQHFRDGRRHNEVMAGMLAFLSDAYAPSTVAHPRPYGMPPYAHQLNAGEIAAVLTFVRGSWGNTAPAVSAVEVERHR